jgi:hypothetical protein
MDGDERQLYVYIPAAMAMYESECARIILSVVDRSIDRRRTKQSTEQCI